MWGSRQRHVGLKKGNACRVRRAAWHFVTVTVEQATETDLKLIIFSDMFVMLIIVIINKYKLKLRPVYIYLIFQPTSQKFVTGKYFIKKGIKIIQ